MLPDFFFCPLVSVQQTTSGIGHCVKYVFSGWNQYAECEKQQQFSPTLYCRPKVTTIGEPG